MKIRKILVFAALVVTGALGINAQEANPMMQPLPIDPAIRTGKLANGLTYYVRHNGYPEACELLHRPACGFYPGGREPARSGTLP